MIFREVAETSASDDGSITPTSDSTVYGGVREEGIGDDSDRTIQQVSSPATPPLPFQRTTDLAGKVLGGHYEIVSLIGEGGAGIVYEARHLLLERTVALKILSPDRRIDNNAIRRFQQEAKAVTRLSHPNVVKTYEFGITEDGSPFLAMEYVSGGTVAALISKSGRQPLEIALDITMQVGQGLICAHDNGVIHRDIKPENISLSKDDSGKLVAKILDFGIAKVAKNNEGQTLTETGNVFGSPLYMSPEQCHGKKLDQRSDIYSLGCVLFELLTGDPPFRGESVMETLMDHVQTPPPDISTDVVSSSINNCLQRALAKEPDKRYQSVAQFIRALDAASRCIDTDGRLTDLRFWRSLDRKFHLNDPAGIENFKQRFLTRLLVYGFGSVLILLLAVVYFLYTEVALERSDHQYNDPTAWAEYFALGKRAREFHDYFRAEQFLLQAETNAEFTGQKQQQIETLRELQKNCEQAGLSREAIQLGKRILMLESSERK